MARYTFSVAHGEAEAPRMALVRDASEEVSDVPGEIRSVMMGLMTYFDSAYAALLARLWPALDPVDRDKFEAAFHFRASPSLVTRREPHAGSWAYPVVG